MFLSLKEKMQGLFLRALSSFNKVKKLIFLHPKKSALAFIVLLAFYFCLPNPLFNDPLSMVLEDNQGDLLGARIAADGQWRFPVCKSIPEKYAKALTTFEDKRFFYHWGIDPISTTRALIQNIKSAKVLSGGSTITMQVIRMARKGKSRTITEKMIAPPTASNPKGFRKK
jgi:penicillin-binding protein 1C